MPWFPAVQGGIRFPSCNPAACTATLAALSASCMLSAATATAGVSYGAGVHSAASVHGNITLAVGYYNLTIEYFNSAAGGALNTSWVRLLLDFAALSRERH